LSRNKSDNNSNISLLGHSFVETTAMSLMYRDVACLLVHHFLLIEYLFLAAHGGIARLIGLGILGYILR